LNIFVPQTNVENFSTIDCGILSIGTGVIINHFKLEQNIVIVVENYTYEQNKTDYAN